MKKILASLLLLALATTMHAQTLLKGDMNKDGKLTLADLTALISAVNDNSLIEAINVYEVENSTVIGTWYAADGTTLVFREDGTTNYPGGATYEFMPILGRMLVYDAAGTVVKTLTFKKVTPEYLLEESTINGALTYYTNSAYVVANLTLNRTSLSLRTGGTFPLQVTATPLTALNSSVEWTSSDESVATVNANGLVTAISGGTCTITCTAKDGGGASATCELTVIQLVTDIALNQTSLSLNVGTTSQLSATVLPANASNNGVTWTSSDEGVATVDADGLVTAVSRGTCTITCTAKDGSGVAATCEVTANQLVTNISLSQSTLSLNSGSTAQLSATVLPANANDTGVTWTSSNEDVATVDADGLVTAVAGGSCTITCTAADGSGVSASCEVTVIQLVTSITLSHTTLALKPEEYQKITATILPSNASNTGVTWTSSDESVAEVTSNGFVSAIGLGTCTITCTAKDASGVSATCEVTVMLQPVTDITLSSSTLGLSVDETHHLTATVLPSDANNPNVLWTSSDEAVATVDQTGLVTGIAEGTCTVTASATDGSGVSATCTVSIAHLVTSITLNQTSLSLVTGTNQTLTATISPSNATNKNLTWSSSNTAVAMVNINGVVTAVGPGTCIITCMAADGSGKTANCSVSVIQKVTSIILNKTTLSLKTGATSQLSATVSPSNATNKNVTWSSSNTTVAMVSANGLVAARATGSCTITCTANDGSGISASCVVTVLAIPSYNPAGHTAFVSGTENLCTGAWSSTDEMSYDSKSGLWKITLPVKDTNLAMFKVVYDYGWYPEYNVEVQVSEPSDIEITFNPIDFTVTFFGEKVVEVVKNIDFIVATGSDGLFGVSWDVSGNYNKMEKLDNTGDGYYQIELNNVAAGTYDFRFCANGTWNSTIEWGGLSDPTIIGNGETLPATGNGGKNFRLTLGKGALYNVTLTLDLMAETPFVSAEWRVAGEAPIENVYSLAGTFNGWNQQDESTEMTKVSDGVYSITFPMKAGEYAFKVVMNHDQSVAYPADNYQLTLEQDADITITLDITGEPTVTVTTAECSVYFVTVSVKSAKDKLNLYACYSDYWKPLTGDWPGREMNKVEGGFVTKEDLLLPKGEKLWLIINGEGGQTKNIEVKGIADNTNLEYILKDNWTY